jgi:hypothetical protein
MSDDCFSDNNNDYMENIASPCGCNACLNDFPQQPVYVKNTNPYYNNQSNITRINTSFNSNRTNILQNTNSFNSSQSNIFKESDIYYTPARTHNQSSFNATQSNNDFSNSRQSQINQFVNVSNSSGQQMQPNATYSGGRYGNGYHNRY